MVHRYVIFVFVLIFCGSLAVGREPEDLATQALNESEGSRFAEVEAAILRRTNELRAAQGLQPLSTASYLSDASTIHSEDMLRHDFLSHTSPVPGRTKPKDRVQLCQGWDTTIGENIYRASGVPSEQLAERVMAAWEKSPTHYENLTNPKFNTVGVGVAAKGKDFAVTQVFSLQAIRIRTLRTEPKGESVELWLEAEVREGPTEGGVFVNDQLLQPFTATGKGEFEVRFEAPVSSRVSISQKQSGNKYSQALSFPVAALR